jgi:hypothetical protein
MEFDCAAIAGMQPNSFKLRDTGYRSLFIAHSAGL